MEIANRMDGELEGLIGNSENGILQVLTPGESLTGSLDSLFSTDFLEDLDCDEFAIPEAVDEKEPSLLEALRCSPPPIEEWLTDAVPKIPPPDVRSSSNISSQNEFSQGTSGKPLYIETVSSVSRQLQEAEHRGDAGAAVSLAAWRAPGQPDSEVKIAAGTLHGHVLVWRGATLRWATNDNADSAVTALAWRSDGARILACFARGVAIEYEALRGQIMRRVTIEASALWVDWAGLTAAVLLDASGTAWLLRCTKLFGSRSMRCSRLPGGEAGSSLAAAPLDSRALALAGTKRLLVLCGTHACSASLREQPNCLPLLCWTEKTADKPILVSARGNLIQMHSVFLSKQNPSLTLYSYVEFSGPFLLWLGEFEDKLILLNSDERMYIYNDREFREEAIDLSPVKIVYSSSFYKGVWNGGEGKVSKAVSTAGVAAVNGALAAGTGVLLVLGRAGVARVRRRDAAARAAAGCWHGALRTALREPAASALGLLRRALEAGALQDPRVADSAVRLCMRHGFLEDLWGEVWICGGAEAVAERVSMFSNGMCDIIPPPHLVQELLVAIAKMRGMVLAGVFARFVAGVSPLCAAEALQWCCGAGQWAAAVGVAGRGGGGAGAPLRLLAPLVCPSACRVPTPTPALASALATAPAPAPVCCPGAALLTHTAQALASDAHADRYEVLDALLRGSSDSGADVHQNSALFVLLNHNAPPTLALAHSALRAPPFRGPLGKHNRQRLLRSLLDCCNYLEVKSTVEVLEFIHRKILDRILTSDTEIDKSRTDLTLKLLENENVDEKLRIRLGKLTNQALADSQEDSPEEEEISEKAVESDAEEEKEEEGYAALKGAAGRADCMRSVARLAATEAASRLAIALREGGRALACGDTCVRCHRSLYGSRSHAAWCGHGWHACCDTGGPPPPSCPRCQRCWPLAALSPSTPALAPVPAPARSPLQLTITAPPRPDLEGTL